MSSKKVFKAARRGDLEAVKCHLQQVKTTDEVKREIASIAAENENLTVLRYVLNENPSIVKQELDCHYGILRRAVASGSLNAVKCLVEEHNADILHQLPSDYRNPSISPTVVHLAIQKGHLDILKYFLDDGKLDVNTPLDARGATVLFIAKHHNARDDILKYIIENKNASLTILKKNEENILYEAASQNDLNFIKYVLDERKAEIDINWRNHIGQTLLKQTVCEYPIKGDTKVVQYLVGEKHADVNIADDNYHAPLHCVRSIEMCSYLLENGANINLQGGEPNDTPLHVAIFKCKSEPNFRIVEYLIEHGADVNARNGVGASPLIVATSSFGELKYKICELLVKHGADVNQGDQLGDTPLHYAITGRTKFGFTGDKPNYELFRYFIKCGADVNRGNEAGDTPLHTTIAYKRMSLYKKLVEHGANINQPNKNGETPVHAAVDKNIIEILKFLVVEKHADVNIARNGDKMTPLHWAAMRNNYEICEILVENGANVSAQDKDGKTPIKKASKQSVIQYLKTMSKPKRNRRSVAFSAPIHFPFSAPIPNTGKLGRITADIFLSTERAASPFVESIAYTPHNII